LRFDQQSVEAFRIDPAELRGMGLPEPHIFAVPANTLVVADTLKMQLELLRDGYSNALTGQRPFEMGEKAMDTLLAIKKGQKVPETIYTGLDLVTKDNVAQLLK